jgi:hypothetical protein
MNEFLNTAFTMPTTIFSGLLILLGLYWMTVILGILDIEIFDSIFDLFGGAAEGVLDGAVDGVIDGLGDSLDVGDHDGCLGMGGVPLTIIGTFFSLFGWAFSFLGMSFLPSVLPALAVGGTLLLVVVGSTASVLALGATAIATRPMKKLFRLAPVTQNSDLVGRVCTVTTLKINARYGQAEVVDEEGSTILIQARSRDADNGLARRSKALIFEYDRARGVFYISSYDDGLSEFSDQPKAD